MPKIRAGDIDSARTELCRRLRSRRAEIEAAVATRVYSLADLPQMGDPEYVRGLRLTLSVAIDYAFTSIELGEQRSPPVPLALTGQARAAAREDVGLDTVLRRYFAGYSQIAEYAVQEVESSDLNRFSVQELLRGQAAVFDRLITEVSAEYSREAASRGVSREQRRAERVRRLLAGEAIDPSGLEYELEGWHMAVIAAGPNAADSLRRVARVLDKRLLLLGQDGTVWAWLGCRRPPDPAEVCAGIAGIWGGHAAMAIGEPGCDSGGWRLSHRQAASAFPIAQRRRSLVRYGDVALLASTLGDDLLATSLQQLYLIPLGADRDGGRTLRATLRAYLSARRNLSAAAAALGVSRQTVGKRLQTIEGRLGRYLDDCLPELEAALHLEEFEGFDLPVETTSDARHPARSDSRA
jgi:PucR C-terminal helix-turn-helix domain/GGDEF-like domain